MEDKHLFYAVVKEGLSEALVELLAATDCLLLDSAHSFFFDLCLTQGYTVQSTRALQVRHYELVGELELFLFIRVDNRPSQQRANCAGNHQITHANASINQSKTNTVQYCTLRTAFILDHADQDLNLVLLVELLNNDSLKTFTDVLGELAELPIVLAFSSFQRAEGRDCVLYAKQEFGVVGTLIWPIDQTQDLSQTLFQQTRTISMRVDAQLHRSSPQLVPLPPIRAVLTQSRKINIDHSYNNYYTTNPSLIPYTFDNLLSYYICTLMSIYSGFPTRRDEEKYNGLLSKLILTLQGHLLQLIGESIPHAKVVNYSRILNRMRDFQEHKYLPPKFSQLLEPLCKLMGTYNCIEQRITLLTEQEEAGNEKVKVSTQSLQKYHLKSQYQTGNEEDKPCRNRADSLVETAKVAVNDGNNSKRSHFQSSFELKQRKFNCNALPPKDKQKSTDYDDSVGMLQKWTTLGQTKTAKGMIASKIKSNIRYRNFQPFQESQENMRKAQKTTQRHPHPQVPPQ